MASNVLSQEPQYGDGKAVADALQAAPIPTGEPEGTLLPDAAPVAPDAPVVQAAQQPPTVVRSAMDRIPPGILFPKAGPKTAVESQYDFGLLWGPLAKMSGSPLVRALAARMLNED
jgi:hypothetical protein